MIIPETLLLSEVESRTLSFLISNHNLINDLKPSGYFYNKNHEAIYEALYSLKDASLSNELLLTRLKPQYHEVLKNLNVVADYNEQNFKADIALLRENGCLIDLWTANEDINLKIPILDRNSLFDELAVWRRRLDSLENYSAAISKNSLVKLDTGLAEFFAETKWRADNPDALLGYPTGLDNLDKMTFGLVPQNFIICAGRPGAGKTAFVTTLIRNFILRRETKPFLFFSLEMSKKEIVQRLMSSIGRVNFYRVRAGTLTKDEWLRLAWAGSVIKGANVYIDDTPSASIEYMADKVSEFKDLSIVALDYIQLATAKAENKRLEVSAICIGGKNIAKKNNVAFIGLSQLNREGEKSVLTRRPSIDRLKESAGLEEAADLILMLYRDKYYDKDTKYGDLAEIIVGKQRNGETGTVFSMFLGQYVSFENVYVV